MRTYTADRPRRCAYCGNRIEQGEVYGRILRIGHVRCIKIDEARKVYRKKSVSNKPEPKARKGRVLREGKTMS